MLLPFTSALVANLASLLLRISLISPFHFALLYERYRSNRFSKRLFKQNETYLPPQTLTLGSGDGADLVQRMMVGGVGLVVGR